MKPLAHLGLVFCPLLLPAAAAAGSGPWKLIRHRGSVTEFQIDSEFMPWF